MEISMLYFKCIIAVIATLIVAMVQLSSAQQSGSIVFSKSPIDIQNPVNLISEFKAGDYIYAVVYFTKAIPKLCQGRISDNATKETVELKLFKDGVYATSMKITLKNEAFQGKAILLDIAPATVNMSAYKDENIVYDKFGKYRDGAIKFSDFLANLDAGKHTVKIEINACYELAAAGEFTVSGANYEFYESLVPQLMDEETKGVTMPTAKMTNPQLEAEMIKAMKASGNDAWKGKIVKVVIIDPEWCLERHKISGAILFRYLRAVVAVKNDDGNCWMYKQVTFKQDYIGDKFAETRWDGAGDRIKIPCENIK